MYKTMEENQLLCLKMQKQGEVDGGLPGGGDGRPPFSSGFTRAWSAAPVPPHLRRSGHVVSSVGYSTSSVPS